MMNSENDSKKIIDLVNMAKLLMDEKQQPSVTQELGILFPNIRGRGMRGGSSEFLRVGARELSASVTDTNNTSFATRSTTKRTIEEIWGSKVTSKKPLKSMSHKEKLTVILILSRRKPSDLRFVIVSCHFSGLIFRDCSFKFSKQKVSYFEPFQSRPKGI